MTYDEVVGRGCGGPPPRRRSTSGCSDMMCGALDCTTCHGPSAADHNEEPGEECSHCGVWFREEELSGLFYDRICYECKEED